MPKKIKDDDGEEIEVFTQEELDAQAQERAEELAAAKAEEIEAEKQEQIDALEAEKAEAQEKLEKLESKDMNFEKLRNSKKAEGNEDVLKQIEELNVKIADLTAQPKNEVKDDFVREHLGDDEEKVKLFDHYYEKLGADASNKSEVVKAAEEALTLVTGGEYKPDLTGSMQTAGASQNYRGDHVEEESDVSKEFGKQLGVTEKDKKKYGNKES